MGTPVSPGAPSLPGRAAPPLAHAGEAAGPLPRSGRCPAGQVLVLKERHAKTCGRLPLRRKTLTIGTNPSGGTLGGTLTVTVSDGIATFIHLSIDFAGDGYTLHATTTGLSDADSVAFSITA